MKRAIPLLLLVLAAGCQPKLNEDFTFEVSAAQPNAKIVPSIKSDRKVNISAKTNGGKIDVYFFLKKDETEVVREIGFGKRAAKVLASELKTTDAQFSATVPANEEAMIQIESSDGKKVEVKLKITS
jgi:hypothetical protein